MKEIREGKVIYYAGLDIDERRIFSILDQINEKTLAHKFLFLTGKASYEKPDDEDFHDWKTLDHKFSEGDAKSVSYLINKYPSNSKVVEMGVWKGWSTSLIIPKLKKNYNYICVDWFKGSPTESCDEADPKIVKKAFWNRIIDSGLKGKIKLIEGNSVSVSKSFDNESIDVFFLDGAHMEPYFSNDVKYWSPKIKVGGTFSGHDWSIVGKRAKGFFTKENGYEEINIINKGFGEHDCWAYKKISKGEIK